MDDLNPKHIQRIRTELTNRIRVAMWIDQLSFLIDLELIGVFGPFIFY